MCLFLMYVVSHLCHLLFILRIVCKDNGWKLCQSLTLCHKLDMEVLMTYFSD